jgi:hypothetical protein
MIVAKSVRRIAVMTTVAAACAAPAASARVADEPPHQAVTAHSQATPSAYGHAQDVPPRVDGIGSQPNDRSGRAAVPIVQASSNGGFDWASAAIGAAALLSVTLLGAAGWAMVRGRRVTVPRRSRPAS